MVPAALIPQPRSRLILALASIAWMGLIFALSSLPGHRLPHLLHGTDKVVHATEYAVLGALLCAVLNAQGLSARWLVPLAAFGGALYGLTDEWHQSFVPNRDASGWDALADAVGATLGALAARRLSARGAPGGS